MGLCLLIPYKYAIVKEISLAHLAHSIVKKVNLAHLQFIL